MKVGGIDGNLLALYSPDKCKDAGFERGRILETRSRLSKIRISDMPLKEFYLGILSIPMYLLRHPLKLSLSREFVVKHIAA